MSTLRSWRALLVREYLEHRIAFLYFPLGIMGLLVLSGASAFGLNRIKLTHEFVIPSGLKVFEIGYLGLFALWIAYLSVALFFYFGDAFSADRRNNAMFFWKSMPISDLKMLGSKFLAGVLLFPAIIVLVAIVSGALFYLFVNVATMMFPALVLPSPLTALASLGQITVFGIVYVALTLVWYAPFLAWVGGLSTVFGRWSLPLAFVIPGLIAVVENVAFFGYGPRGGYFWQFISQRLQFGLSEMDYGTIAISTAPFDALYYSQRLVHEIDWPGMGLGVLFAALVMWLASEYRRRRIK